MSKPLISAYTSVNKDKVPVLFTLAEKAGLIKEGCSVLDYGNGRWPEVAADFLKEHGAAHVSSYDPYWFPNAECVTAGGYDLVCLSNVLNVIPSKRDRNAALAAAWGALKPGGRLLVTVYEGDASGASGPSKDGCWQERRELQSYMDNELAPLSRRNRPRYQRKAVGITNKPAAGEKWYPPVGTKLTLSTLSGNETPYTVIGIKAGKIIIRECDLVFSGERYFDSLPDEIHEGTPGNREEELVWKPKHSRWSGKGRYGGWVSWGSWSYQPYLD